MTRVAILDDYQGVALESADWSRLGDDCEVVVFRENLGDVQQAAKALAGFDVLCLMRERMPLPASLIEALPRLKLAVMTGTNARCIDLDRASACGVSVCSTTGGEGGLATPELAWGLILAAARHIPAEHEGMRQGKWQETLGTTLSGGTLGLLGLGRIGKRMVPVANAFGMKVVAWSPHLTGERAEAAGARMVDKAALFESADVVSVHLVLGPGTKGLVGRPEIGLMRPGSILVNTSRGPIIEETALLEALQEDRIRAGLDVYDQEPLRADHPLRRAPNVVLTPHLGYVTERGFREFYESTVETILAWRAGHPERLLTQGAPAAP